LSKPPEIASLAAVQLDLFAEWHRRPSSLTDFLLVGGEKVRLWCVRNPRARRYVLRVRADGSARVTIPRAGSAEFALEFARKNRAWIAQQLQKRQADSERTKPWVEGTSILFRGEEVILAAHAAGATRWLQFADQIVPIPEDIPDFRPLVEGYLWTLADKELPARTFQLAAQHQLSVARVRVKNQRSRWGSCSVQRTVSLNWRLVQAPPAVRDYLIVHELMHLKEMNHSPRFWTLVALACPAWAEAEAWLDEHAYLLRCRA
jgi:predicted metal-dependent hydrolase